METNGLHNDTYMKCDAPWYVTEDKVVVFSKRNVITEGIPSATWRLPTPVATIQLQFNVVDFITFATTVLYVRPANLFHNLKWSAQCCSFVQGKIQSVCVSFVLHEVKRQKLFRIVRCYVKGTSVYHSYINQQMHTYEAVRLYMFFILSTYMVIPVTTFRVFHSINTRSTTEIT